MSNLGYITINGEKVRVLIRQKRTSRCMKLRYGGSFGSKFSDESAYIAQLPEPERIELAARLWRGEVVEF